MQDTLIAALATLSSLQRWNFLPRVETWVETENIAYMTHIGYAIGRASGENYGNIEHFVIRSLLKSFNKHYLSDIPIHSREILKKTCPGVWEGVVKEASNKASKLFPRKISSELKKYLTQKGDYIDSSTETDKIETLVKYVQNKVAYEECEINGKVYNEYEEFKKDIRKKIDDLVQIEQFEEIFKDNSHKEYFSNIKRLKYLRRWNRINRFVESSVLSHTYVVSFLALLFSTMSTREITDSSTEKENFRMRAILRALFHDVPESLSGDLISPVKEMIAKQEEKAWRKVEEELINQKILAFAPSGVKSDIETYKLLEDFDDSKTYSIDSMVKYCDKLALVLECVFEKHSGKMAEEMILAFNTYLNDLQNSEWRHIREFSRRLAFEFPLEKHF